MSGERIPTGAEALDKMTEGGFPRGSLIILAGSPGSGKSMFAVNFTLEGFRHGEKGVFASFTETKDDFIADTTKLLGRNCVEFTGTGKCEFLELSASQEGGAPVMLQSVLQRVEELGAARLVIDSFSRVSDLLKDRMEARITLHSVFRRLKALKCTTVLTADIPSGQPYSGIGVAEFVADGLIVLTREIIDGRLLRKLEIVKLRGTRLTELESLFTLGGGFTVISPFQVRTPEKRSRFEPRPDPPGRFSTGSEELDAVFGGGYPIGSTVLIELNSEVDPIQYWLISSPTTSNFISKGCASITLPSTGVDHTMIKEGTSAYGFKEDEIASRLRVCTVRPSQTPKTPFTFSLDGVDAESDNKRINLLQDELLKETGHPFVTVIGFDSLVTYYGAESATKIVNVQASRAREKQSLCITLLKPGYEGAAERLGAIANVHMKIIEKYGSLLLCGIKPRTNFYAVGMDVSKGYSMPMLLPIM